MADNQNRPLAMGLTRTQLTSPNDSRTPIFTGHPQEFFLYLIPSKHFLTVLSWLEIRHSVIKIGGFGNFRPLIVLLYQ